MENRGHIIRFIVLLVFAAGAFFILRGFLVPDSFGTDESYTYRYYRADSVQEQADIYPLYRESAKCMSCHEEEYQMWHAGTHSGVSCESCHGPWRAHNNNTKEIMTADSSSGSCLLCHGQLDARPSDFPQITDIKSHMIENEYEFDPSFSCISCHDPHEPNLKKEE